MTVRYVARNLNNAELLPCPCSLNCTVLVLINKKNTTTTTLAKVYFRRTGTCANFKLNFSCQELCISHPKTKSLRHLFPDFTSPLSKSLHSLPNNPRCLANRIEKTKQTPGYIDRELRERNMLSTLGQADCSVHIVAQSCLTHCDSWTAALQTSLSFTGL